MFVALKILNLKVDDEVIVPNINTANAKHFSKVVFFTETLNIDINDLKKFNKNECQFIFKIM